MASIGPTSPAKVTYQRNRPKPRVEEMIVNNKIVPIASVPKPLLSHIIAPIEGAAVCDSCGRFTYTCAEKWSGTLRRLICRYCRPFAR